TIVHDERRMRRHLEPRASHFPHCRSAQDALDRERSGELTDFVSPRASGEERVDAAELAGRRIREDGRLQTPHSTTASKTEIQAHSMRISMSCNAARTARTHEPRTRTVSNARSATASRGRASWCSNRLHSARKRYETHL